MRVVHALAVDPGKMTGLALGDWYDGRLVATEFLERPTLEAIRFAARLIATAGDERVVACESWSPRPGAMSFQPQALESIGALRYLCYVADVPFVLQSPAEAKRFATNEKLAVMGWRNPTRGGHTDDAARHLLTLAVRRGLVDPAVFLRYDGPSMEEAPSTEPT